MPRPSRPRRFVSCLPGPVLSLSLAALVAGCDPPAPPVAAMDMAPPDLAPAVPLGPDEIPLRVTQRCPGDPSCPDDGDEVLYVGVGKRDVTPEVEPFTDRNGDGIWNEGEPFEDKNGNLKFDAYWIAGYGNGRIATGVNDPIWARAIAVRQNQTTVVVLALDTVGLFRDEIPLIKARLDPRLGVDLLLMHATHDHESVDLTGGWGPDVFTYGVNEAYHQRVLDAAAAAVTDAVQGVHPARVTFGSIPVEGPGGDLHAFIRDSRDPVVIESTLHTLQFVDISSTPPQPIGTLVNWANHPEALGGSNQKISSDFVHYLREDLERHGAGTVVYVSGPIGGLLTPGGAAPIGKDGKPITEASVAKAQALGESVAGFALTAMADPRNKTLEGKDAKLRFRTAEFNAHVENQKYHLAAKLRIFRRSFCCYDETRPASDDNVPQVETVVSYLLLGPAAIITNPGELAPELFLGGYDGSRAGGWDFLDPSKPPNAPDLARAPKGPYLVDLMDGERAHRMTFGLTMDFLGYILPRYNFVLSAKAPYIEEAEGDHYEETNSIGPRAEPEIVGTMRQLILDGKPVPGGS